MQFCELSLTQAARHIKNGDMTAEAYANALLDKVKQHQGLNAFITLDQDLVLEKARLVDQTRQAGEILPPLAGVPIAVKDNIETKNIVTTGGTPFLKGYQPKESAEIVTKLEQAGAFTFGKTNMHELAYGITNNNAFYGAARNPHAPDYIAGGSSGGSAVAVSAKMCPVALGTDTGGSVRIPASLCGIIGFRPSTGRWSQNGIIPISSTRDTAGPIARFMEDIIAIDQIVTGQSIHPIDDLKGIRLGIPENPFWQHIEPDVEAMCRKAIADLETLGIEFATFDMPNITPLYDATAFPIALCETATQLPQFLNTRGIEASLEDIAEKCGGQDVGGILRDIHEPSRQLVDDYKIAMSQKRSELVQEYQNCFKEHKLDGLIFPTTPSPAIKIGEDETFTLNGKTVPTFETFIQNTGPGTMIGIPGISLPIGKTKAGLPLGIEIDAAVGRDADLLEMALKIEQAGLSKN